MKLSRVISQIVLLMVLSIEILGQNLQLNDGTYLVKLVDAGCEPTRRIRCSYVFQNITQGNIPNDEKNLFYLLFYMGADQIEENGKDALTRLDQFFEITGEKYGSLRGEKLSISYKKEVKLEIKGSKYKFTREDGKVVEVDREKKTRP